ncbi:AraC family transcriptional regulator [Metabacillus malikii]|uniref:AraC-like DNA-binding protein n=1 Tax=Metabacillus malikii TaxID=1504265 RepID=A0ABT9ZG72_9BACI|nr:AraC family transcriptional regulator [Metabacillus malikii]MDQ0230797.1 AraC-like DNA-binding protein [Metabacillus malikii]
MEQKTGAIVFRFTDDAINEIAQIWSVGWDEQHSTIYNWSGTERKDQGKYIFQYTLSGHGEISIDGHVHKVGAGQAFIVSSPSNYHYYLPKDAEKWEFLYLTLYGHEVKRCWDYVKETTNQVLHFHPESTPIKLIKEIYDDAKERKITNAYKGSKIAYHFIMELYEYLSNLDKYMEDWSEGVIRAALFARNNYQDDISSDEMAAASQLSRYHFTRIFKKETGLTPVQYLTSIRLQKATELLQQTKYTVDEIAQLVGYKNANYLNKVTRKQLGKSPGQIRQGG